MAINREKKAETIEKLTETFKSSGSAVFVNFHGLTVADTSEMRRVLKKEDVHYVVAKKTLIRRALEAAGFTSPDLPGEVAVVYGNDAVAPASGINKFVKKFKDQLSILGGIFEGQMRDKEAMTEIAGIPTREVLLGQFVNVINSPIQGLVIALDAIAGKKS